MVEKLKRGMQDSDRRTKRSLEKSSSALAKRRLSACIMLFSPHPTSWLGILRPWKTELSGTVPLKEGLG